MGYLEHLPEHVGHLIQTRFVCEFATITKHGVPIDSPLVPFVSADLQTIDSGTGLAYPVKAERLRRNPKAGMLFEGGADEPVVLISGYGATHDRDLQGNLERYLSEEILMGMLNPALVDYATVTHHAVWYFTRIIMCVKPAVVRWWDSWAATDGPPHEWRAPAGTTWPQSDPAPTGKPSPAPWGNPSDWLQLADGALARKSAAHLTLVNGDGFPLPIRARAISRHDEGFVLDLPGWLPWENGKASLSFEGLETFVGTAAIGGRKALFRVERALPVHPLLADPAQILQPTPETRDALMARIGHELDRRGLLQPVMPAEPPRPTPGAMLRAEAAQAFQGLATGD